MTPGPYPLMRPTPTGDWTDTYNSMRAEFKRPDACGALDAPEWMPAGGCYSWRGHVCDTIFIQPHGVIRGSE